MRLDYIEQMLINQTNVYLDTFPITYDSLRASCLSIKPLQPIIMPVLTLANSIATEEMAKERRLLAHQIHQRQKERDIDEEFNDKTDASKYKIEKEHHESTISFLLKKSAVFTDYLQDITRMEREISIHEKQINQILVRENELKKRKMERNEHQFFRTTYPNEFPNNPFSSSTPDIMQKLAEERCYPVFLNQLQLRIDTLPDLSQPEKTALNQIISAMQNHQDEAKTRLQQETELSRLEAALQSSWKTYADTIEKCKRLNPAIIELAHSNELLTLSDLNTSYKGLLQLRNNYAVGTVVAAGLTATSSITAYFLIQAMIISPVFGPVSAAILGFVTIGLIITSSTFAIMSAYKKNEINACERRILNNESESSRIKNTLAECKEEIYNLQEQISVQTGITDTARDKEMQLLEGAKNIKANECVAESRVLYL